MNFGECKLGETVMLTQFYSWGTKNAQSSHYPYFPHNNCTKWLVLIINHMAIYVFIPQKMMKLAILREMGGLEIGNTV